MSSAPTTQGGVSPHDAACQVCAHSWIGHDAIGRRFCTAAYAIGMRKTQVMTVVLLPQAVKIMIPAIISQMVVALKDTSLGYAVAGLGLTRIAKPIYQTFANHVPTIIVITAIYVIVNLLLTALAMWLQRKFVGEKKVLEVSMVGDVGSRSAGSGRIVVDTGFWIFGRKSVLPAGVIDRVARLSSVFSE